MTIKTIRRLAADLLGVGQSRVRFAPEAIGEMDRMVTREDVLGLIKDGKVKKLPVTGRGSARKRERRSTGRIRGQRVTEKEAWMEKIRAQRKLLKTLLNEKAVKHEDKNSIYRKIKSGIFRSKKTMILYLKENGILAKNYEETKQVWKPTNVAPKKAPAKAKGEKQ